MPSRKCRADLNLISQSWLFQVEQLNGVTYFCHNHFGQQLLKLTRLDVGQDLRGPLPRHRIYKVAQSESLHLIQVLEILLVLPNELHFILINI